MKKNFALSLALIMVLGFTLSGCGLFGGTEAQNQGFDTPAQVMATEAESLYREGEYEGSAELFQQIKDQYPYSRFALLADLRVGDAYRKAGRFEEAVLAYDDFIRLHPKNEAVPYAIYQMGIVNHAQILTVDRDPSFARKAVDSFRRLMREYPKSEWTAKCQPRLKEALAHQAGHDFFVGKFYFRTKRYKAAEGRFRRVLTQYPDVGLYGQAMAFLEKSQRKLAEIPEHERDKAYDERQDIYSPPKDFDEALPSSDDDTLDTGLGGIMNPTR